MMMEISTPQEQKTPTPEAPRNKRQKSTRDFGLKTVLLGRLLLWATKLASKLIRLELHGYHLVEKYIRQGRPIIFAGWHGHNFLTILSYFTKVRNLRKATIIVPDSENGRIMEYFGVRASLKVTRVNAALGPSQWARATITMIRHIKNGYFALLSPDGPDGPAYEVKPGIVYISQQTNAVIIPASAAAKRSIRLRNRWDEHLVPLPGSRVVVYFGTPIEPVNEDGQPIAAERLQQKIKRSLDEGAEIADQICRESFNMAQG